MRVRPLRADDLDWTGPLHEEALPHGFFARLGPHFLRAYQQTFLDSPVGIALAAEHEGGPAGFLLGVADVDEHRAWVVRDRRLRLAALGAASLARRPREAARFARTRLGHYAWTVGTGGRRAREQDGEPALPLAAAVLTHVAVLPPQRRGGAGRRLVEAFVEEARARGAGRARLTTLRDDRGAEAFWKALGWVPGKAVEDDEDRLHRVLERKL